MVTDNTEQEAVTNQAERWRGHRVFWLDGSGFSMPDTPELQNKFGQPSAQKSGCGFPVAHLLLLFHAGTGLLRQVLAAPLRTHDMSQVAARRVVQTGGASGMDDPAAVRGTAGEGGVT